MRPPTAARPSCSWLAVPDLGRNGASASSASPRSSNKPSFGILIEPIPIRDLPAELTASWQFVDLAQGADHRIFRTVLPDVANPMLRFPRRASRGSRRDSRAPVSMPAFSNGRPWTTPTAHRIAACGRSKRRTPYFFRPRSVDYRGPRSAPWPVRSRSATLHGDPRCLRRWQIVVSPRGTLAPPRSRRSELPAAPDHPSGAGCNHWRDRPDPKPGCRSQIRRLEPDPC